MAAKRSAGRGPRSAVSYNSFGGLVATIEIENGNSGDIGVPEGGKLLIQDTDLTDPDPSNTDGAAGTYETV
jgi:hypothetical protein